MEYWSTVPSGRKEAISAHSILILERASGATGSSVIDYTHRDQVYRHRRSRTNDHCFRLSVETFRVDDWNLGNWIGVLPCIQRVFAQTAYKPRGEEINHCQQPYTSQSIRSYASYQPFISHLLLCNQFFTFSLSYMYFCSHHFSCILTRPLSKSFSVGYRTFHL